MIGKLSEGLIGFRTDNKIGFINTEGREIIEAHYNWAYDFHSVRAVVYNVDKWGFIDTTGKLIIPFIYDQVRNYSLAVGAIGQNTNKDRWGIINTSGKYILEPTYDELYVFKDGLAKAIINGQ
jgi:hypothetical protein